MKTLLICTLLVALELAAIIAIVAPQLLLRWLRSLVPRPRARDARSHARSEGKPQEAH
jgi:hypothetical protein